MDLKMCRICGGIEQLKNILVQDSEMLNKLLICAGINIHPGDLLPKLICVQCEKNLDFTYRFRKQSESTQERLRLEMQRKQRGKSSSPAKHINTSEGEYFTERLDCGKLCLSQYSDDSYEQEVLVEKYGKIDISLYKSNDINVDNTNMNFVYQNDEPQKKEGIENQASLKYEIQSLQPQKVKTEIFVAEIHEENNEICSDFITKTIVDDCKNTLKEVDEVPIVSEYCSIDLVSSPASSTNECYDDFQNEQIRNKLTARKGFTCDTCHEIFTKKDEYRIHIKQHGLDRYQCIQCCKFFPSRFRLKRHEEIHNEISSHQCSFCNRNFRALYNLKRHIKSAHLGKKCWECNVCNISFSRVDVLKRHLLLHSDEKKFSCSMCSQSFKTKDYLSAHHKSNHNSNSELSKASKRNKKENKNKYQCGYCGKLFKSSFAYKNHLLIHTNEKPYKCESCNKYFRTIAALTIHQRIHDDYRPYQCDLCLKSFRQTAHLKEHRILHLDNVPKHFCSICQATFAKKSNLKAHTRIHTEEKPFKCADCSAEFSYMHLLQRHASKVHYRSVHKVYTLNDVDEALETNEAVQSNASLEAEMCHYIDTVADDDDDELENNVKNVGDLITNNQNRLDTSSLALEEISKPQLEQHIFENRNLIDSDNEPIVHFGETSSLNSIHSQISDEYFVDQINGEMNENCIIEQKVDPLTTEEIKLTSMEYNDCNL